tara:strand:- start:1059 stop:1304 length:246 start_codon:yes stop_codon:yes gene_type:complete
MERKSVTLKYISTEILHTDPRNKDLTALYKQIQTKGVSQAWTEYIIEDFNDLIMSEGPKHLLNNLSEEARKRLVSYIQSKK